jgi:hypothetical protein
MQFYTVKVKEKEDFNGSENIKHYNFKYVSPGQKLTVTRINEKFVLPIAKNQVSEMDLRSIVIPDEIVEDFQAVDTESNQYIAENVQRYFSLYEKATNFYTGIEKLEKTDQADPTQYFKNKGVTETQNFEVGEDILSESQVKLADQIMSESISKLSHKNASASDYSTISEKIDSGSYQAQFEADIIDSNKGLGNIKFYAYPKDISHALNESQIIVELENATEDEIKSSFIHGADFIDSIRNSYS